jgi:hypothetical protein
MNDDVEDLYIEVATNVAHVRTSNAGQSVV